VLKDYFSSLIDFKEFHDKLNNESIGRNIIINGIDEFEIDQSINIVMFSVEGIKLSHKNNLNYSKKIRKKLYRLSWGGWNIKILDLGFFKIGNQNSDTQFAIREILEKLVSMQIKVVVLNLSHNLIFDFYYALKQNNNIINIVSVDNKIPANSEDLSLRKILDDENCKLGEYSNVGFQKHINNMDEIKLFESMMFEMYSLGKVKNKITNTEPIFRNSDLVNINIRAVKSGDINNSHEFTNGLSSYEYCTLCRFAGLSTKLNLISFNSDYQSSAIISLISEGIWYAIDGMDNVVEENIDDNLDNYIFYNISVDDFDLKFVKSIITNKWWVTIENINLFHLEKTYIPCVEDDYLLSKSSVLSDRILTRIKNKIT